MKMETDGRRSARAGALRALANDELRLERRSDGQLWARRGESERPVRVSRLFPWTEPGRYVSLRDREDEEVALVSDLPALDGGSRKALEHALCEAGFVLEVEGIVAIEEEIEIRTWKVRTRQGARSFQTLRDEWPREMPDGSLLIRDVAGDLYRVSDPGSLDRGSRDLLWAYVD
jgi:hypothetical protein